MKPASRTAAISAGGKEKPLQSIGLSLPGSRRRGRRGHGCWTRSQGKSLSARCFPWVNDFKASDAWFTRWKKRFNVACKKEQGGNQSAGKPASEQWQCENLPHILEKFSLADVYSADEARLYLKGLCDRGHRENNEKLEGGKAAKDRVTVPVCANMDGSDKRPLFMIGKLKRPQCFPEDFRKFPLNYVSSANAWMTGEIFINWLKKWDH
ncbi:unnamed protein product [Eretmochelys imbricata]